MSCPCGWDCTGHSGVCALNIANCIPVLPYVAPCRLQGTTAWCPEADLAHTRCGQVRWGEKAFHHHGKLEMEELRMEKPSSTGYTR